MNFFQGSWIPKVLSGAILLTGFAAQVFPNQTTTINAVLTLETAALAWVTRQNNKSSEAVGAKTPQSVTFNDSPAARINGGLIDKENL